MSVDDIAANGAEPLFFLDYISVGKLVPGDDRRDRRRRRRRVPPGRLRAARRRDVRARRTSWSPASSTSSASPSAWSSGRGCCRRTCKPGDAVVGFASGGLRCNGYSLARRALLERRRARRSSGPAWAGAPPLARRRAAAAERDLRAVDARAARVTSTCTPSPTSPEAASPATSLGCSPTTATPSCAGSRGSEPRIFAEIQAAGAVADAEMEQVFNLGLGMLAVVPGDDGHAALDAVRAAGHEAWVVGEIIPGHGRVTMASTEAADRGRITSPIGHGQLVPMGYPLRMRRRLLCTIRTGQIGQSHRCSDPRLAQPAPDGGGRTMAWMRAPSTTHC